MKEALFFEKQEKKSVQCRLCPHSCVIQDGKIGICRVRKNIGGTLFSLNFGRIVAAHGDPMEKKPLYHFFPGEKTFSIAMAGCNFHCWNCQNYGISQVRGSYPETGEEVSPDALVAQLIKLGYRHLTFTYTEPTVFYEFMLETAKIAVKRGIFCSLVSNGFIGREPLEELLPFISAANIDLKFSSDRLYRNITGGWRQPVVDTIRTLYRHDIVTEVTTLIIPGLNDGEDEFGGLLRILLEISTEIPWHLSAFYPTYKMTDHPPTPPETLTRLRQIARSSGLKHVYTGNITDLEGSTTFCPNCRAELIVRSRLSFRSLHLDSGACPRCGSKLYGKF